MRFKLITLLLIFSGFVSAQNKIQLVVNSKSSYSIITSNPNDPLQIKSAKILQEYINKISGCTLPVLSHIQNLNGNNIIIGNLKAGAKDTTGLGADGILIKTSGSSLILSGGFRKGVLYSTYTFLQDYLGCRRYSVADIQVPHTGTIQIPALINRKEVPTFFYRMTHSPNALNNDFCDWYRLNYFMEDWGLWVHSFSKLLPSDQYFSAHPEYFALFNGKRVPDQPNLSNPAVLKIVSDNLKKLIAANPKALYWSVSQNDNQHYCQCPECTKLNKEQGSPQGSLLTFVNAIAKQFPDKIITTLAYQYSEPPPKTLRPAPNVMIMLTTASEDRRTAIKSQTADVFNQYLRKWGTITNNLFVWNYIAQFENALSPFPDLPPLQPDIQLFAANNVKYMFEQGIGAIQGEFTELKTYLVSQLMWNKNVNVNQASQNFLKGFYGANAAKYISAYINILHKNAALSGVKLSSGAATRDQANTYLSLDKILVYKRLLKNALAVTDTSTTYYKRVTKEYLSVLYAELEIRKLNIKAEKSSGTFNKQQYISLLNEYHNKMKWLNIIYLNEVRKKVDDYYASYLNTINQ